MSKNQVVIGDLTLSAPQVRALRAAAEHHGIVVQARAFGLDKNTAHAINGKVYRQLVGLKLLTPHQNRAPFKGEALTSHGGKAGYLTSKGDEVAAAMPAAT